MKCLGENTKKCITFSVPVKKIDNSKTIRCKWKLIDRYRFMSTSLSKLVKNLSEKLHSAKCKDKLKEKSKVNLNLTICFLKMFH